MAELEKKIAKYLQKAKMDGVLDNAELETVLRLGEGYLALDPSSTKIQSLVAQCRDRLQQLA